MFNTIKVNNTDTDYTHSIFDISDYNSGATYANLSAALAAIPESKLHRGMTIRYVLTDDNKYVQYRLMADEFTTTDTTKWAIADEGVYVDNPEFAYVKIDNDGKILYGVKTDGEFFFGEGCPQQIKDYIQEYSIDKKDLFEYLDETFGKYENSPEYLNLFIDKEKRCIEAITKEGRKVFFGDVEIRGNLITKIDFNKLVEDIVDIKNKTDYLPDRNPIPFAGNDKAEKYWAPEEYWEVIGNTFHALKESLDSENVIWAAKSDGIFYGSRQNFTFTVTFDENQEYFEGGGGKNPTGFGAALVTLLKDQTGSYVCLYQMRWTSVAKKSDLVLKCKHKLPFILVPSTDYHICYSKLTEDRITQCVDVSGLNGEHFTFTFTDSDINDGALSYFSLAWGRFGFLFLNGTGIIKDYEATLGNYDNPIILATGHSLCEMNALSTRRDKTFLALLDKYLGGGKVAICGQGGANWDTFRGTYGYYLDSFPTVKYLVLVNGQNNRDENTLSKTQQAYAEAIAEATKRGVEVIGTTLAPEVGNIESGAWENYQVPTNNWIRSQTDFRYIDLMRAITDENGDRVPELYITPLDSHPNEEGCRRIFEQFLKDIPEWSDMKDASYKEDYLLNLSILFNDAEYSSLQNAINAISEEYRTARMGISYKSTVIPAVYRIDKTEHNLTYPSGAIGQSLNYENGNYIAEQLSGVTLPTALTGKKVYYSGESGNYTIWTITKVRKEPDSSQIGDKEIIYLGFKYIQDIITETEIRNVNNWRLL